MMAMMITRSWSTTGTSSRLARRRRGTRLAQYPGGYHGFVDLSTHLR